MSSFSDSLFVDREKKYRGFKKLLRPETRQAVMLIQAPEKMGKTWLTMKLESHCNDSTVDLPVVRLDFRNTLDILKITDHLALIRLLRDRFALPDYFRQLNATINRVTGSVNSESINEQAGISISRMAALAKKLQTVFDLAELEQQARFMDVQFENIKGTTLFDKAYGLVSYFARRSTLQQLFDMLQNERPHVAWQADFGDLLLYSGPPMLVSEDELVLGVAQFNDQLLTFAGFAAPERARAERMINESFFDSIADLLLDKGQVVFLLDGYESAPQVAKEFITNQLLVRLLDERLRDMVIVICGRQVPDVSDLGIKELVVQTGLDAFNETYVRDFMRSREIPEETDLWEIRSAMTLSGGVPGILALMADQARMVLVDDDDFFE